VCRQCTIGRPEPLSTRPRTVSSNALMPLPLPGNTYDREPDRVSGIRVWFRSRR
jgi:hypothetical protein